MKKTLVKRLVLIAAVLAVMIAASAFVPVNVTNTQAYEVTLPPGAFEPEALKGLDLNAAGSETDIQICVEMRGGEPEVTCILSTDDPSVVDEFVTKLAGRLGISSSEVMVEPVSETVRTSLFNLCRVTITGDDLAPGEKRDISDEVRQQLIEQGGPVGDVQAMMERPSDGDEIRIEVSNEVGD